MINKCDLCDKTFEYPYLLKRHKDNKTPCNKLKETNECKLCNTTFTCLAKLKRHEKTKKHITNVTNITNIHNGDNITNNHIHIHITKINSFIETNLDVLKVEDIEKLFIYEDDINFTIKTFKQYPDEIYGNTDFNILIFKFFIKIFTKLNFIFCNQKILAG